MLKEISNLGEKLSREDLKKLIIGGLDFLKKEGDGSCPSSCHNDSDCIIDGCSECREHPSGTYQYCA